MSLRFLAHLGMAFSALFCTFFAFSGATDSGFSAPDCLQAGANDQRPSSRTVDGT
jgi:hypothetical protein